MRHEWYVKNKKHIIDRKRNRLRLRKYNIDKEQYNKLLQEQQNKCAICGIHQSKVKFEFSVDHNHETGRVRGLLCIKCNSGIGLLQDSVSLLRKATNYLKKRR